MKEFARILSNLDIQGPAQVLEQALNREIAIPKEKKTQPEWMEKVMNKHKSFVNPDARTVHHNIVAQPDFIYAAAPVKQKKIEFYH